MKKVAICDDDKAFLYSLKNYLYDNLEGIQIDDFSDGKTFLSQQKIYDIIFLDIDMPGIDGITVAQDMRFHNDYTKIIFVSGMEDMIAESIHYAPFRFVRKRRYEEDVEEAVNALKQQWDKEKQITEFKVNGNSINVSVKDILYIESGMHKITVHTEKGNISVNETMEAVSNRLSGKGFLRIHKGYLVNYRVIKLFQKEDVLLKNGEVLLLSKYRKKAVLKDYQILLLNEKM